MSTRVVLDLTQTHFIKERGDLTMYGAWHGDNARPCIALLPSRLKSTSLPLVIVVDDAYKWNPDDESANPQMNAILVNAFLHANGFEDANHYTRMRVISFVHDYLGDLMRIPPKPMNLQVVADAYQTDADGKVTHKEIREHV